MAQDIDSVSTKRVSLPGTEIHTLHAEQIGQDFELWIAHPQAGFTPIQPGSTRILYVLDANLFFGTAVEMTRLMHKLFGELPPFLVVGIAYPTENSFHQSALRTRDFTPSEATGLAGSFPQMPGVPRVEPAMGGAASFLAFLEQDVKPYVQARFNASEEGSILFGSSLGGLFVTYALLNAPASFDNYIAVSPALWWNNDELLSSEMDIFSIRAGYSPQVFFGVGSLEESSNIPGLTAFKMITNARNMASQLPDDIDVRFEVIDGETHTSVVSVALTRGLRHLTKPAQ